MGGCPTPAFLVVFEHREIRHPKKSELASLEQAVPFGILMRQRYPQQTGRRIDRMVVLLDLGLHTPFRLVLAWLAITGHDDDQVICLRADFFANLGSGLRKRFLQALEVFEQLGAAAAIEQRLDLVPFLAGQLPDLRDANRNNRKLGADAQGREIVLAEGFADVGHCRQAHIRLVAAIQAKGLVVAHAREREVNLEAAGLEGGSQKSLYYFIDPLGLRIRHFQVDLGEFGLAICPQVLIAKAAHDLEVLVESRDHENLLEQLRRLRQSVKAPRLDTARYQVVACALRRRAGHEWRFDLEEPLAGKIAADGHGDLMP